MKLKSFVDMEALDVALQGFKVSRPFNHCVVDDFINPEILKKIECEFLSYDSPRWFVYDNPLEHKKALNDWNAFPDLTYSFFSALNSKEFADHIGEKLGLALQPDVGLHGGGWHIHGSGGNLNPHLDYSIHPKLGMQRKLNLILYVSSDLREQHGGHLGFWKANPLDNSCAELDKEIFPAYNRAVLFDTTQNSWHGLSRRLSVPPGVYRKSLAIYYLCEPERAVDERTRALYAPREDQKNDKNIESLIRLRADSKTSHLAYVFTPRT